MNRRQLLAGLLAAPAVAVAAHFKAPEWMGEEIREELIKDLSKTQVQIGAQVFDNRPVWTSVSGVRQVWMAEVGKALAKAVDAEVMKYYKPTIESQIKSAVGTMVQAIDMDLAKARVTGDDKVIIDTPKLRLVESGYVGSIAKMPKFELVAGVEKKRGIFGAPEHRVGYLQESIIV